MRRFIFILMIALLPLRGWIGEAMATEMAAMNTIATQAVNRLVIANLAIENSMTDCDMHNGKKPDMASHTNTKLSCNHCQACHATGLLGTVQTISSDIVHYAQPLAKTSQFASANIAQSQKPPIL